MKQVEVYSDGACLGNPGPGGWAALLRCDKRERELVGGEHDTTNNRMELMAVIAALEALREPCAVSVYTDSQYVQKGVREWVSAWKRRGWRTSGGALVKNRDLWERLLAASARHRVDWQWIKGHAGHVENERVDRLARTAAERERRDAACVR